MFTPEDLKQIEQRGIALATVEQQIETFKKGFPYIDLVDIATIHKGIIQLDTTAAEKLATYYNTNNNEVEIVKFVPASGAASRMFKDLLAFLNEGAEPKKDIIALFENLNKYALYDALTKVMANAGIQLEKCIADQEYKTIAEYILTPKGLDYAALPKALLKFHNYTSEVRTSLEEHLVEGAIYAESNKTVRLHFTVSPEHKQEFIKLIYEVKSAYETKYKISYTISFSTQDPATDTIAVDLENKPFRDKNGKLVFRPGGHGALIKNLNEVKGDIVFIKNIDNVVPDRLKADTILYKKAIGGLLLQIRKQCFEYLTQLDNTSVSADTLNEIISFITTKLYQTLPANITQLGATEQIALLKQKLNKPIRICGVVKNEGEPGGGPFFVKNNTGDVSLQIVESAQINLDDSAQKNIFDQSTHFNPVDLVCSVRDYKGTNFDLNQFVDPTTGFISQKSKDGKDLKAMELPGLWNGAMADWITLFVEVPVSTFNPVKTIFDLARDSHKA